MRATSPKDICSLFRDGMAKGDIEAVLRLYDPAAAFVTEAGEVKFGVDALRKQLAPVAAERPCFNFDVKQIVQVNNIALMHTWWTVSFGEIDRKFVHAIEIASRQPDGDWHWLIGDPFTVGRLAASKTE